MLFLIDRKHFRTDELAGELEAQLRAGGMNVLKEAELSGEAFYIKAVLGHERRMEENIAELLGEMGYPTELDKRRIRAKLGGSGARRSRTSLEGPARAHGGC